MKSNFDKIGMLTRFILAIVLAIIVFLNFIQDPLLENILLIISLFMFFTAIFRYCPLYHFLGVNTKKISNKKMKMY